MESCFVFADKSCSITDAKERLFPIARVPLAALIIISEACDRQEASSVTCMNFFSNLRFSVAAFN